MDYATHPSMGKPMGATCETLAEAIEHSIDTDDAAVLDYSDGLYQQAMDECEGVAERDGFVELRGSNMDGESWTVRLVR